MKKAVIVVVVLVVGGLCVGGGVVGAFVYALAASKTYCIAGTRASVTVDGLQAILKSSDAVPHPSGGRQVLECPQPTSAPIVCRYPAGLGSTYTIRDDGALGITLIGDEICESLRGATEPAGRPTDTNDGDKR